MSKITKNETSCDTGSSVDDQFESVVWDGLSESNNEMDSKYANMNNGDVDGGRTGVIKPILNGQVRSGATNGAGAQRSRLVQTSSCSRTFTLDQLQIVEDMAYKLGIDIALYVSSKDRPGRHHPKPFNVHAKTLRRLVNQLSERHKILFTSMVKKLQVVVPESGCTSFVGVADEIFSDGIYNWGRIATLYTFAGWLAKYCVENNIYEAEGVEIKSDDCEEVVRRIGNVAGKYVAEKLAVWIAEQGGWDEMDRFFPEQENLETKVWRGLFYTVVGLGALAATTVAGAVR